MLPSKNSFPLVAVIAILFLLPGLTIVLWSHRNSTSPTSVTPKQTISSQSGCPLRDPAYTVPVPTSPSKKTAVGAIISHHLLASRLIVGALSQISPTPETIILIGPNHQNINLGHIQTTNGQWDTEFGTIQPNEELIIGLQSNSLATSNDGIFRFEHSVCDEVAFIKRFFPGSRLVPLILKANTSEEESKNLGAYLAGHCQNCLMIASVDFSHEASPQRAQENDRLSSGILQNIDTDRGSLITADSVPSLRTLMWFLHQKQIKTGRLIQRSDSNLVSGRSDPTVTSYLTMIF